MFTAQGNRLNSHYNDDLRFCRVEGVVNHYQRLKDAEQLQAIYEARDAAVGVQRIAIEAAIPVLENYMMIRSSVIMRNTTCLSQIVELSHDDISGSFYFTGSGMAKAPMHQFPPDAVWYANNFDLGWITPKLCHIKIYFKNTDAELFYKDFGFAYVTSNHGINPQSAKQNMINDWGYRNEIFEYHYETEVFKKLRGNWNLSFLQQPLNTHYRLMKEAYDLRHTIAPSNYESNNILLFDGKNMTAYPGKHPLATCSQYFDLSRVDPDARGITIYFFPWHEKELYQDHGFAYIIGSPANNNPYGSRAYLINKFHNPIFATYYGHLPGRTYNITYPKRWRLEMDQVEYDWSIEKARQEAKHKKHMAIVKGVVGIGLGAFASTLVPGLGSQLLTAILRGAAFGGVSSTVQGGNIAKGTFQGALFAGLNHTLSSMSVLKDAKKLQDALRIGVTAAISAEMNGENVFKSMLIAVGTDALVGQFMKSEGLTQQEALIRAFGKSAIASVLGGQNLGNSLMSGFIGTMGELAQQTGEELGNDIKDTVIEENVVEKPKKSLIITDGKDDDKLVLAYNEHLNEPQPTNLKERMEKVNESLGINNNMDSEEAGRKFAADKSMKELEKWIRDNPNDSKFKNGVESVYMKDKYMPCLIAGGADNLTDGLSAPMTDLICQEKNSIAYKTGEALSELGWLFKASKDIKKLPMRALKEVISNEISQDEEDISVKYK